MKRLQISSLVTLVWLLAACSGDSTNTRESSGDTEFEFVAPNDSLEATSFLRTPLYSNYIKGDRGDKMRIQLAEAEANWQAKPDEVDSYVWYGRRLAYLGRYRDAINVYSRGLDKFPGEAHLLRHRAHRYITIRKLDAAIADFEAAAESVSGLPDEIEPDGQPNAAGIPTSTLQTNIWYHVGLAHYLKGDFDHAVESFQRCFDLAANDDMRVAAADWLYMSMRRAGWHDEADRAIEFVTTDIEVIENDAYLQRLLMYRGLSDDAGLGSARANDADGLALATLGYGVANWLLMEGEQDKAYDIFESVLDTGTWAAFGYIASEADIARITE
ncbi:MAG: hypothetical protein E2O84_04570 [Bacteroidetes bacterium]|nr:MAG: hypothetical protein E2O84_04570 [Bacteroidota bacterium]